MWFHQVSWDNITYLATPVIASARVTSMELISPLPIVERTKTAASSPDMAGMSSMNWDSPAVCFIESRFGMGSLRGYSDGSVGKTFDPVDRGGLVKISPPSDPVSLSIAWEQINIWLLSAYSNQYLLYILDMCMYQWVSKLVYEMWLLSILLRLATTSVAVNCSVLSSMKYNFLKFFYWSNV